MPRKLPWQTGTSTTTVVRATKTATRQAVPKRKRDEADSAEDEKPLDCRINEKSGCTASSSLPPQPPAETFMCEGMDKDDKYRMVEDEFLSVAQRFTTHLHNAEYKRLQKEAKSRNADTISSISRPVVGMKSEATKRKAEAVARARAQKAAIDGLGGKGDSNDSDDGGRLPYVGTTLHGLMDSPRKKAASISNLTSMTATTRAAAGFKHSAATSSPRLRSNLSPQPNHVPSRISNLAVRQSVDTSDDDDDLSAIPVSKFVPVGSKSAVTSRPQTIKTETISPEQKVKISNTNHEATDPKPSKRLGRRYRLKLEEAEKPTLHKPSRRHRVKIEDPEETKPSLNIIPTFF